MLIQEVSTKESRRQDIFNSLIFYHPQAAQRFIECGKKALYRCEFCGNKKLVAQYCRSRLCQECSKKAASEQITKLLKRYDGIKKVFGWNLKFITLPVKTNGDFRKAVEKGGKCLTKLWNNYLFEGTKGRRKYKKGNEVLSGLVAAFEFGPENGNLHIHCIYYGRYIPQKELSREWLKLTDDSYVVDVRAVKQDPRKGMIETIKYITDFNKVNAEKLVDYFEALKGKRRIRTFGVFYGINFKDKNKEKPICEICGKSSWISEEGLNWQLKRWRDSS